MGQLGKEMKKNLLKGLTQQVGPPSIEVLELSAKRAALEDFAITISLEDDNICRKSYPTAYIMELLEKQIEEYNKEIEQLCE